MRILFLNIISLCSLAAFAQEELLPLQANQTIFNEEEFGVMKINDGTFDSTIIYAFDPITLPYTDDFSKDRYAKYSAQLTDPGVTDTLFYQLNEPDQVTPLPDTSIVFLDTTYRIVFDSVNGERVIDSIPLPGTPIYFKSLTTYPIQGLDSTAWPRYYIYDTTWIVGDQPDTIWLTFNVVVQDSARAFFATDTSDDLWVDTYTYRNYTFAIDPPSLGVATFDGTNENGYPYNISGASNVGRADYLTTRPIDLSAFTPDDSIILGFYYQAGGFSDPPEDEDSLIVEFYSSSDDQWYTMSHIQNPNDQQWHYHTEVVEFNIFLNSDFRFRIVNVGERSGLLDIWNVDYVNIKANATVAERPDDLAITYPPNTLLNTYTAVPWAHYIFDPSAYMGTTVDYKVSNGSTTKNAGPTEVHVDYQGVNQMLFSQSTILNYNPYTVTDVNLDFTSESYEYDPSVDPIAAQFDVKVIASTPTPQEDESNDTAYFVQNFANYYGYDDGSAELIYSMTGFGAELAQRYEVPYADSLIAVKIYFTPFFEDMANRQFLLTVWDDNSGEPGEILYQDDFYTAQTPWSYWGRDRYSEFFFHDTAKIEVSGSFYIGYRQIDVSTPKLYVGFDANLDNSDKLMYNVAGYWQQSAFPGTVMMQPVFSGPLDSTLTVEEVEDELVGINLYPNPATDVLMVELESHQQDVQEMSIIDGLGRTKEMKLGYQETFYLNDLAEGMYFMQIRFNDGHVQTVRFVKQ